MGGPAFDKKSMHFAAAWWHRCASLPCKITTFLKHLQTFHLKCLLFSPDQPISAQISQDKPRSSQSSPDQRRSAQISPDQARSAQIKPDQPRSRQIWWGTHATLKPYQLFPRCRNWTISCWSELIWLDLNWFGLIWVDLGWSGLIWLDLEWSGVIWVGLGWSGLIWVDLGWCGVVNRWKVSILDGRSEDFQKK